MRDGWPRSPRRSTRALTSADPAPSEQEVLGWFQKLSNWGRWGPDDRLGTLNHIAAAKLVRAGESVSCGWDIRTGRQPGATVESQRYMIATGLGRDDDDRGLMG